MADVMKRCKRCLEELPLSAFTRVKSKHGEQRTYYSGTCRSCASYRSKERDWRNHGINMTLDEFEAMVEAQGGVCAICGQPETATNPATGLPKHLHVDHDHRTGAIRGLLCTLCNVGISALREDAGLFAAALEYLERAATLPGRDVPEKRKAGTGSRTHCPNGHEWTQANIYRGTDGERQCRICRRLQKRLRATGAGRYEGQTSLLAQGGDQ